MKKLLSLLLALALIVSLVPAALAEEIVIVDPEETVALVEPAEEAAPEALIANPSSGSCGENLSWTLNDGVLTVSGEGEMDNYDWGKNPWYSSSIGITKIVVEEGVTAIGDYAFCDCGYLTEVSLPESLTFIGNSAFSSCMRLASVSLPDKLDYIGSMAFIGCDFSTVTIPAAVESIGEGAFADCQSLTEIKVASANENFKAMNGVLFADGGQELVCYPAGKSASSYTVPSRVTVIGAQAFCKVYPLTQVQLPSGLKTIGHRAFSTCTALQGVVLPEGLQTLAANCFEGCTSLTAITIPASVEFIHEAPFEGCTALTAIKVAEGNARFLSEEGVLFDDYTATLIEYPAGKPDSSYHMPGLITAIADYAFHGNEHLKSLTVSAQVQTIGVFAFAGCFNMTTVRFEGSAPSFGAYSVFAMVTANAYYPAGDATWTREVRQNYDGQLTWKIWTPPTNPGIWVDSMSTGGVCIAWSGCEGAEVYELQRKDPGGDWVTLRQITGYSYNNVDPIMGVTYQYRVRGLIFEASGEDYESPWSAAIDVLYNPFGDVSGKKTIEYLAWAYNNGIVNGTSDTTFSPDEPCSRIQFVMMLWKMHGCPNVSGKNPFSDVSGSKSGKAIVWALKAGVINSGSKFYPDETISRVQIVMILWKLAGSPTVTGTNPFKDVSGKKTTQAVLWAYQSGLTKGTTKTTFSPDDPCTRIQLVVFLFKYNELYKVI